MPSTPNLLVSSADDFCKQFRSRSGLTRCQAGSGSKLFGSDTYYSWKIFFSNVISILKKSVDYKKACKITQHAKNSENSIVIILKDYYTCKVY